MKKAFITLLTLTLIIISVNFGLIACNKVKFSVNFIVDGEVYETVSTGGYETIQIPVNPTKDGYTFDGWYWDNNTWNEPFTANSLLTAPLSSDMSIYAKFTCNHPEDKIVTDDRVEPTDYEDGLTEGAHCSDCGKIIVAQDVIPANIQGTAIKSTSLKAVNNTLACSVSNNTQTFSFLEDIKTAKGASYIVAYDITCERTIHSKTAPLEIGDNIFYIFVTNGENSKLYEAVIRRLPMYTVSFNANGGTSIDSQLVEEGSLAPIPSVATTKSGYSFAGWDYDFSKPITDNTIINALWTACNNTPYKVEYYLQNLELSDYDLISSETENLYGTTDTNAEAEKKTFEHFTFNPENSILSGNIDGEGNLVLKVYYTRDNYTVSNKNSSYGSITNTGSYAYGKEITLTVNSVILGRAFGGWYSGDKLISTNTSITVTIDNNIEARFDTAAEMKNFEFTSTATTCYITGIKDKAVTEILVPSYVTVISSGAFKDCSSLTSITIPSSVISIGDYAFYGCSALKFNQYDNAYYLGNDSNPYLCLIKANDTTISSCIIHNDTKFIYSSAFYDCSSLTSITIPDSVTSIGEDAFYGCSALKFNQYDNAYYLGNDSNPYLCLVKATGTTISSCIIHNDTKFIYKVAFRDCSSLTSIEIPDSVTSIGESAFLGCSWLKSVTIGGSVENIGWGAFKDCSSLTSITLPDSVTSIGSDAFHGCSFTNITIPDSVTSIGVYAFLNCSSLTSIKYRGTESQWNAIIKGDGWDDYTGNYTITYNYSEDEEIPIPDMDEDEDDSGTKLPSIIV